MSLPLQEAAWPERPSGGAVWAVTRREHRFKGKEPEGASGRQRHRVPGSEARLGNRPFTQVGHALGTKYHLPSLPPHPKLAHSP